jgi:hypothetical protein
VYLSLCKWLPEFMINYINRGGPREYVHTNTTHAQEFAFKRCHESLALNVKRPLMHKNRIRRRILHGRTLIHFPIRTPNSLISFKRLKKLPRRDILFRKM